MLVLVKEKKIETNPKKNYSIAEIHGYTHKDFKKWGKLGGRPALYANAKERYKAYRRRKTQIKLNITKEGISNLTTGRISKYRTNAERQKAYRKKKGLKGL